MLRRIAVTASRRSFFIRTTSALSMATSVPAPIAIPTSALARAGASFTPSPIMATVFPCSWSFAISRSLSCGMTSAITVSISSFLRIASAVLLLSPVSMTTSIPSSFICCTAWRLVGFTTSATERSPIILLSSAKIIGVFPSSANASNRFSYAPRAIPCAFIMRLFPAKYQRPSIFPFTP